MVRMVKMVMVPSSHFLDPKKLIIFFRYIENWNIFDTSNFLYRHWLQVAYLLEKHLTFLCFRKLKKFTIFRTGYLTKFFKKVQIFLAVQTNFSEAENTVVSRPFLFFN